MVRGVVFVINNSKTRVVLISSIIFLVFGFLGWWWQDNARHGKYKDLLSALYIIGFVKINYYQPVDVVKLVSVYFKTGSIAGTLKTLNDPYTQLLSKDEFNELKKETNGFFDGIGIYLQRNEPVIWKVAEGTPGEKAGLHAGDRIIAVDHIPVISSQAVINRIKGQAGTEVWLRVARNQKNQRKEYDIQVIRAKIYIPTVQMKFIADPVMGKYAYVKIDQFADTTARDLGNHLNKIDQMADCKGILLDLRANPGGLLEAAVDVLGNFLPQGTPALYIYKRGQLVKVERTTKDNTHKPLPLVALIDNWSASATEIVAGALKDQKRAPLIGTPTFGKDLIQEIKELPGGIAFKITVYNYLTSGMQNIHKRGVQPTQMVGKSLAEIIKKGDTSDFIKIQTMQEEAALKILRIKALKQHTTKLSAKLAG